MEKHYITQGPKSGGRENGVFALSNCCGSGIWLATLACMVRR